MGSEMCIRDRAAPFAPRLFWDGRAASLKEQVMGPLHDPREMNHDAAGAVARLRQTDAYPPLFLAAFGAAADAAPDAASAAAPDATTAPPSPVDADRMARAIRVSDVAARLGGDEFAVLLMGVGQENAQIVAEALVEGLSLPYPGVRVAVSASVGIAVYPHSGITMLQLLELSLIHI